VLRAVHGLASIGVQIGGIVANKISDDARSGYYGYGGYGYGYGYGYGEDEGDPLQDDLDGGDDFSGTEQLQSGDAEPQEREKQLAA
jgi:Mrp family chromosome partitioning ATPase